MLLVGGILLWVYVWSWFSVGVPVLNGLDVYGEGGLPWMVEWIVGPLFIWAMLRFQMQKLFGREFRPLLFGR